MRNETMIGLCSLILFCFASQAAAEMSFKMDCHHEPNATESKCLQRKCHWRPSQTNFRWCRYKAIDPRPQADCHPEPRATMARCMARGCVWKSLLFPGPWCRFAPSDARSDCHPEPDATVEACEARGCLWDPQDDPAYPYCYVWSTVGKSEIRVNKRTNKINIMRNIRNKVANQH